MDRKHYRLVQKILAVFLTGIFLFQPLWGIGVLAEGEPMPQATTIVSPEPTQSISELTKAPQMIQEPITESQSPSPTPEEISPTSTKFPQGVNEPASSVAQNKANAGDNQTISISNNNSANITNDISATANSGQNQVNSPSPTISTEVVSLDLTPMPENSFSSNSNSDGQNPCEQGLLPTSGLSPTPTPNQEGGSSQTGKEIFSSPTPVPEILPTPAPVAENIDTPDNSQNEALGKSESKDYVDNDNKVTVENEVTATASSGQNESIGEGIQNIQTGETTASADLANTVNFNVVGQDFWAEVFNLLGVNNGDLDFSSVDISQKFQEAFLKVFAKNLQTGDFSSNVATASFLSSLSVFNNNIATVSNILDLSVISGQNTITGGDGEIYTGSASIIANLFNLINTNLVGSNFWFGVFNIFGEQNGDIILPYELQFLLEETNSTKVEAVNQEAGENSQNQANASGSDIVVVKNNNEARVNNNVDILADSGTNRAEVFGSAEINTGNATAKVDIRNFINNNIFGNRFVFLLINVFGKWQGALLGWWGNLFTDEKTVIASGQWPVPTPFKEGLIVAQNQQTGENSQNTADASLTNSLTATNNNEAYLKNEIKGRAISGQNEIQGDSAKIETGSSSVFVNIANFVNTNIIGNNFFFGIINIFGNFFGNILFPRPDLEVVKTAEKETAKPGEEINYTILYKNTGRLWAKDVEIIDYLPAGVSFVSASNGGIFENGKVIWKLGKINSGQEGVLFVKVAINNDDFAEAQLINQVLISTSTDEPNKNNNQSSVGSILEVGSSPGGEVGGFGVGGKGSVGLERVTIIGQSSSGSRTNGSCIPPEAPKAPILLSATAISPTEVKLSWTSVDRASYYLVAYGLESGNYIYGSPNVGNVNSYVVGKLTTGLTYYFVVAGVTDGDCPAPSPYSNELSSAPGIARGGVLNAGKVLASGREKVSEQTLEEVAGTFGKDKYLRKLVLSGVLLIILGFSGLKLFKRRLAK